LWRFYEENKTENEAEHIFPAQQPFLIKNKIKPDSFRCKAGIRLLLFGLYDNI